MNSWSRVGDCDTSDVMNFESLKFYLGTPDCHYSYTGDKVIGIADRSSRLAVIGWMVGHDEFKQTPRLVIKNETLSVQGDTSIYSVDIDLFTQIPAEDLFAQPDDFFHERTDIDMIRNLAQRKMNHQSHVTEKGEPMMTGIKVINDIVCESQSIQQEMIAKVDKKTFVNVYANYLNNREKAVQLTDSFLLKWAEAKYRLYMALGNNLELTNEFEYEMDEKQMKSMAQEIMTKEPLGAMINHVLQSVYSSVNPRCFSLRSYDPITAFHPEGAEVSLSRYLSLCGLDDNHPTKKEIDKLLGSVTTKGVIHISVDPIAYLMQSTNKHNWSSCHGWTGGTSAGSISYALDNCSFVTFLCNEEMVKYKKGETVERGDFTIAYPFTWYSMKNRMMVYLDTSSNVFQTSRLYPQGETWEIYEKEVRSIIENSLSEVCNLPNTWKINRNAMIADESKGLYNDGANGFNANIVKHKDYTGNKPSICLGTPDYIRNQFVN